MFEHANCPGSRLGALLDQLTDRLSSCLLLLLLSHLFPAYFYWCVGLIALDIASHWLQFYSTLAYGRTSHKEVKAWLLRMYYTTHLLLVECVAQEVFLVAAYMTYFTQCPIGTNTEECPVAPTAALVPFLANNASWAANAAYYSAPLFLLKQIISVVQLWEAVCNIVELDEEKPVLVGEAGAPGGLKKK